VAAALAVFMASALEPTHAQLQSTSPPSPRATVATVAPAPTTPPHGVVIRVGLLASIYPFWQSNPIAAFLVACAEINSDPGRYLGNTSLRIEPYVIREPASADQPFFIRSQRGVLALAMSPASYTPVLNSTTATVAASASTPVAADVDAIVFTGLSSDVTNSAIMTEVALKPAIASAAMSDVLSDKGLFPTVSRVTLSNTRQAKTLALVSHSLGWHRVGILYSQTAYGAETRDNFRSAARMHGIDVVAEVAYAPDVSPYSTAGQRVVNHTARLLRRYFRRANVQVYLLVGSSGDLFTALLAANVSRLLGPSYSLLLPAVETIALSTPCADPVANSLVRLTHGSIGVLPDFINTSEPADRMWQRWPRDLIEWAHLFTNLPPPSSDIPLNPPPIFLRSQLTEAAYYAYDATILTAKAIACALESCVQSIPGRPRLNLECTLNKIRTTTVEGTTGRVALSEHGDRVNGQFMVLNLVDDGVATQRVARGFADAFTHVVEIATRNVIWSDNSTNRTTGPAYGQRPPPPLDSYGNSDGDGSDGSGDKRDRQTTVAVAVPLSAALMAVCVAAMVFRRQAARRRGTEPADFREVIHGLVEHGVGLDFTLLECAEESTDGIHRVGYDDRRASDTSCDSGGDAVVADDNLAGDSAALHASSPEAAASRRNGAQSQAGTRYNVPTELDRNDVVLEDVLGRGQFGEVCCGQFRRHGGVEGGTQEHVAVAVKTVHKGTQSAQTDFLEEAAVTWQFCHDNVVRMYGVITTGFPFMMVLELCEVGQLLAHVQQEERPVPHLLPILRDVTAGMAYLASKCFVHRDLAARNVLLDAKCRAKLSDFGLGRRLPEGGDMYRLKSAALLPIRWTDPVAMMYNVFNEATDVWAFGVLCVEVFSRGALPYGNWPHLIVLEAVHDGYRLPRPAAMPRVLYTKVVLPCWAIGSPDSAINSEVSHFKSDMAALFRPRPTFAELMNRFDNLQWSVTDGADDNVQYDAADESYLDIFPATPSAAAAAAAADDSDGDGDDEDDSPPASTVEPYATARLEGMEGRRFMNAVRADVPPHRRYEDTRSSVGLAVDPNATVGELAAAGVSVYFGRRSNPEHDLGAQPPLTTMCEPYSSVTTGPISRFPSAESVGNTDGEFALGLGPFVSDDGMTPRSSGESSSGFLRMHTPRGSPSRGGRRASGTSTMV